ncbi:DUF6507 family protein, partial [Crystallibacter crystallopoietes]|uniref:DUF6507 family protein n=1 Tax=Crystallibacter crystallopoietes TaxID=37928 RepID=UPI00192B3BE5
VLEAAARLTGATQSALTRAENAAAGTRDAISAYAAGDLEMAANAQQFSGVSADF